MNTATRVGEVADSAHAQHQLATAEVRPMIRIAHHSAASNCCHSVPSCRGHESARRRRAPVPAPEAMNKSLKDFSFLMVRSVGWNLGTLRELVGGAGDWVRYTGRLIEHGPTQAEFTQRMAYTVMMPTIVAMIGYGMTWMYTGRAPRDMYDYFFPPTGGTNPKTGAPERVIIPSYMKDVMAFDHAPIHTLLSKTHPMIEVLYEIYNNRDYYGGIIKPPDEDLRTQFAYMADYFRHVMTPFSISGFERLHKQGAGTAQQIGAFMGFQPAPAWITSPERQQYWQRKEDWRAKRRRLREMEQR